MDSRAGKSLANHVQERPMLTAEITTHIEPPWLALEPLRVGEVPATHGTPDAFVLVQGASGPVLRLDVYTGTSGGFRQAALVWHDLVVIGIGDRAFTVDLTRKVSVALELHGYFSGFWSSPTVLLALDASSISRIDRDGSVSWRSGPLALDGVAVTAVDDEAILGDACIDPPERWVPFAISLKTGFTRSR
jgi:hypothetical protein